MLQKEISLFKTKNEFFLFLSASIFVLLYSLLIEFHNYKQLTQFDSNVINATVVKQYLKSKKSSAGKIKTYQVLKFKAATGFTFYSTASKNLIDLKGKQVTLEIFFKDINFFSYMSSFFAYHKIISINKESTFKQKLNTYLDNSHSNTTISNIYKALYTATPLNIELQTIFSTLGVSHLLAISGFHLGVLSGVLFFLLKYPYKFLQNRYFPYRNATRDLFITVALLLLSYLLFLDSPPSLLRAFFMLIIGFILYDRGFKILSMQTLLLTVIILLAFFPRLFLALGLWLSVAGVFYIFLFLIHFKHLSKVWQFILIPFWVYLLMLPFSLIIFKSFTVYHPLSIVWTSLFTLFYPLSIFFHITGFATVFDGIILNLLHLSQESIQISLNYKWLILYIGLSFMAILKKSFMWITLSFSFLLLLYSLYKTT